MQKRKTHQTLHKVTLQTEVSAFVWQNYMEAERKCYELQEKVGRSLPGPEVGAVVSEAKVQVFKSKTKVFRGECSLGESRRLLSERQRREGSTEVGSGGPSHRL